MDENALFERVAAIIENRKNRAATYANSEVTLMFWEFLLSSLLQKILAKPPAIRYTERDGKPEK
ncbi:MAG: hypothetical protein LBS10_05370 [Gracilibacteraceae bacterium]|nr:hypothetical protein [Gracilibacteraceae bacterium]